MATRYCLDTEMVGDSSESMREVVINPCESTAMSQRWEMVMSWPHLSIHYQAHLEGPLSETGKAVVQFRDWYGLAFWRAGQRKRTRSCAEVEERLTSAGFKTRVVTIPGWGWYIYELLRTLRFNLEIYFSNIHLLAEASMTLFLRRKLSEIDKCNI